MKVDDNDENAKRCLCPNCPTYDGCMKGAKEMLYCGRGKSSCKIERAGCLCGECPVASDYQLTDLYFCDKGKAE